MTKLFIALVYVQICLSTAPAYTRRRKRRTLPQSVCSFSHLLCCSNTSAEGTVATDERVGAAVVFGQSKFQPGVLISPAPGYEFDPTNEKGLAEFRGHIWQDFWPYPDACIDPFH